MSAEVLHPFVLWGQRNQQVFLSVHLQQVENNPLIKITDESIDFMAKGYGCHGLQLYSFQMDMYLPVDPDKSRWFITEKSIEIVLHKSTKDIWPRFTYSKKKAPWLKIDFDRFQTEDSTEEESDNNEDSDSNRSRSKISSTNAKKPAQKDKLFSLVRYPLRIYLVLFNLFQIAGYGYVFAVLLWHLFTNSGIRRNFYMQVAPQLGMVQLAACLEVAHSVLGWVRSGFMTTFLQVFGRNLVLFALIVPYKDVQTSEVVFWLFLAWSTIELVRYPFYLLNQLEEEIYLITYLRYTIWIPLYPLGFVCEGLVMLRTLPLIEEHNKFSYDLPNSLNVSFNFGIFMRIYMIGFLFGAYILMTHMHKQRRSRIGPVQPQSNISRWGLLPYFNAKRQRDIVRDLSKAT